MSAAAAASGQARRVASVRDVVNRIRVSLGENFPRPFWLQGELSSFRVAGRGHGYGRMKDESDQVEIVIWASSLRDLRFRPENGMLVHARVRNAGELA